MKLIAIALGCFLLTACADSDGDTATSFVAPGNAEAPMAPTPVSDVSAGPAAPGGAEMFCRDFAKSEAWNAAQLGEGAAVQGRIAETDYHQCMATSNSWID